MLLDGAPSWRQGRWPQPVNQAQDLSKQGSWYGDLCHLERDTATVANDVGADLDQLLSKRGHGPLLDLIEQGQRPEEVAQDVGEGVQLKTHLVVAEAVGGNAMSACG